MIKHTRLKLLAVSLCAVMALCSCGINDSAPTLMEPVGAEPTFRPVEKADLGISKIIIGHVMGMEYCHFYEKSILVKDINVSLGDYVHKGDILLEADTDSLKEQITELNASLSILKEQYESDKKKEEIELEKLEIQKEQTEYNKNMGFATDDMVKAAENAIESYKENHAYSEEMYEFQKRKINESLTDLNKIVNEGVIRAKNDGYVTYIRDFKNGYSVPALENIITITDDKDLFISGDISTQSYVYDKYGVKFAFLEGRKVPIDEYDYTDSEVAFAKAQNTYPVQRFIPLEDVELKIGESVLMQFYNLDKNDVLVVGKDSYQTDDEGAFVYVKAADGTLEKRYFEVGSSDDHYVEVVSGLEEGEPVLYTQEATLPKNEGQYEVVLKTYENIDSVKGIKYVEDRIYNYFSEDKAEIDTIYVQELNEVKKGDPLLRIIIDSEKGKLVQIENRIKDENRDYESDKKDFDKEYEDLHKKITDLNMSSGLKNNRLVEIKKLLGGEDTGSSDQVKLAMEKAQLEYEINSLAYDIKYAEMDLKLLEYNKDIRKKTHDSDIAAFNRSLASAKKDNDGTGYKTIYAEHDAKITTITVAPGDKVDVGKKLVETVCNFDNIVKLGGSNVEAFGYNYDITYKDEDYNCTVIMGNNNPFAHVFTEEGKVYCTPQPRDLATFYVKVNDEDFFKYDSQFMTAEVTFPSLSLANVFRVPGDYIFTERSFDNKEYNYVWVLNGDEVFKRYVQTGLDQRLGTLQTPVIINGLHEGDILVK